MDFGKGIWNGIFTLTDAIEEQINLKEISSIILIHQSLWIKKEEKVITYGNANKLLKGREKALMFLRNQTQADRVIILTSTQMLQRLLWHKLK